MQHATLVVATVGGLALGGCGSTKTVTVTNTVIREATTTTTTTVAADTTPTTTGVASATTPAAGATPALSGTYSLNRTNDTFDANVPLNRPHDGYLNADQRWSFTNGSCAGGACQVSLRRTLSDSTIEDLTLFSDSPAGVYTGTIPGGDGDADCGGRIKLTMNVRVGGLQDVDGQTVASRLLGHIFIDYQCPGSAPTHDVATYVGTHS